MRYDPASLHALQEDTARVCLGDPSHLSSGAECHLQKNIPIFEHHLPRACCPNPISKELSAPCHGIQPPTNEAPCAHSSPVFSARDGKCQNLFPGQNTPSRVAQHMTFLQQDKKCPCPATGLNPDSDTKINNPGTALCGQVPLPAAKKHALLCNLQLRTRWSLQLHPQSSVWSSCVAQTTTEPLTDPTRQDPVYDSIQLYCISTCAGWDANCSSAPGWRV